MRKPSCTATEMARGLEYLILKVEGLYYPCMENKGTDQLRGNLEADLRLCFRICRNPVFSQRGSVIRFSSHMVVSYNMLLILTLYLWLYLWQTRTSSFLKFHTECKKHLKPHDPTYTKNYHISQVNLN